MTDAEVGFYLGCGIAAFVGFMAGVNVGSQPHRHGDRVVVHISLVAKLWLDELDERLVARGNLKGLAATESDIRRSMIIDDMLMADHDAYFAPKPLSHDLLQTTKGQHLIELLREGQRMAATKFDSRYEQSKNEDRWKEWSNSVCGTLSNLTGSYEAATAFRKAARIADRKRLAESYSSGENGYPTRPLVYSPEGSEKYNAAGDRYMMKVIDTEHRALVGHLEELLATAGEADAFA